MKGDYIIALVIIAAILIALAWYVTLGWETVNQEVNGYVEKNVTFAIPERSIQFCVFGDPAKSNPVCGMYETKGKSFDDFDDFVQAFIDDRVTRSYEVKTK